MATKQIQDDKGDGSIATDLVHFSTVIHQGRMQRSTTVHRIIIFSYQWTPVVLRNGEQGTKSILTSAVSSQNCEMSLVPITLYILNTITVMMIGMGIIDSVCRLLSKSQLWMRYMTVTWTPDTTGAIIVSLPPENVPRSETVYQYL